MKMIELKKGEYVDNYQVIKEGEIFLTLILKEGEYTGILTRKD